MPVTEQMMIETLSRLGELAADIRQLRDDHKTAAESRLRLHTKVDGLSGQVCQLQTTVSRIAPIVDEHERAHQQRAGQRKLIGGMLKLRHAIWAVIVGGLALIGIKIGGGVPG